ncbi:glycosyl hydrolase [Pedobacter psychrophilus]|uniref:Glycosyl hydrolase n=1 Tax=Pedobacter psychrophilus TaxID=1826909 RepID=A0A179DD16_9SPHI|nr:glycoside hydrolase family 3 C-terminal domain-containing protein [Pedobacter psychrophilus]OAQ38935.1 glycosyl hydrolase [Pedobacter psychrophilus]
MRKLKIFLLLPALVICFTSVNAQKAIYLDENQPIEKRIEHALSLMTVDEKVALCHAQSTFTSAGVPRLGIPYLKMSDGPHGIRAEGNWDGWKNADWTIDSCLAFPALTCLAATFNPQMSLLYGRSIGEEARYREKNVLLGPGVNIYRTPLNGRNFEYMGEDPFLASIMVVPYITGVQENGVAACLKHYAFNNQEKNRFFVDVDMSDRAMREIYLPAFHAGVTKAKVWSVMGAYNLFRGQYCNQNDLLLNKILKTEWKFDGAVISDWGGVHGSKQAIEHGLDIEMGTGTDGLSSGAKNVYDYYYMANPYKKMLANGEASVATLNDKVRRILRLMYRTSMNNDKPYGSFVSEAHSKAAKQIAEEGIVLLKNQNSILPLNLNGIKKIAVIGENATRSLTIGGGSSGLKVKYEISPLKGIQNRFGSQAQINYQMGYAAGETAYHVNDEFPSKLNADSLRKEAIKLAAESDLVIFVGGLNKNSFQDSEDADRKTMDLPYNQNLLVAEIAKVNKKVVVVLISGNAITMPWLNQASAVVQSWYLGSESGNAIASILSGDVNPSGKLPFTFPKQLSDNGAHSFGEISYPGVNLKQYYKDDILVGYRWHDTKKIAPQFEFGYGLSYTTFSYKDLKVSKTDEKNFTATFTVTNTGKVYGAEVSQLYVKKVGTSIVRAEKELKGFDKIFLKPGESKIVSINIDAEAFRYYNESIKNWDSEKGKYELLIGGSSRQIFLKEAIII